MTEAVSATRTGAGRNIIANLIGGAWVAVLTLLITPLQVNILGMEAYGLIGFIATLQMILSIFDLGLSTTITRELARDHSQGRVASLPLLRTGMVVYWSVALVLGCGVAAFADPIAAAWFNAKDIPPDVLAHGIRVIAIFLALRWPVAFYSGVLSGLQRMDILNLVRSLAMTVRLAGGALVLVIWRDLAFFLWWLAVSSAMEVVMFGLASHRVHPAIGVKPSFSVEAFREIWGFAVSMNALALITLVIVQADRVAISKLLPLAELGYYSLAYNTVTGVSLVLAAFGSAMLPSFAAAHGAGNLPLVEARYRKASASQVFIVGGIAFPFALFGRPILTLWVSAEAAEGAWLPLALLAAGFWFSALYTNAYNLLIACGRTATTLRISLVSAIPYCVALALMVLQFGIAGAAATWLALTIFYTLTLLPAAQRTISGAPLLRYVIQSFGRPLVLALICFGGPRLMAQVVPHGEEITLQLSLMLLGGCFYLALGYAWLGDDFRAVVTGAFARLRPAEVK